MKTLRVLRASEHNLRDISLDLPRESMIVLTGVSGSGKSSLAFDTIYKEGRRRFLESLSSYARQFLGGVEKPRVETIEGLSPAVAIEQKTVSRNPRSTVGTITEVYDHLRLLFARLGVPHCPRCAKPVRTQSPAQVAHQLIDRFRDRRLLFCAPVVLDRKGEHRREIEALFRDGYRRFRVDGAVVKVRSSPDEIQLQRRQSHTIEVIHERLVASPRNQSRLVEACEKCFALAEGRLRVVSAPEDTTQSGASADVVEHLFSSVFACPDCGVDLPELEPRIFSFNSHHGACPNCHGIGEELRIDSATLIRNPSAPFRRGGLAIFSERGRPRYLANEALREVEQLLHQRGHSLESSWGDLDDDARIALLWGDGGRRGLVEAIDRASRRDSGLEEDARREFRRLLPCHACGGARLSEIPRGVSFHGRTLPELCSLPISRLSDLLEQVRLEESEQVIGGPIIKEMLLRLDFLEQVGLSYLTLDRPARTLAGGEAQRIRLATQVGAGLQGVVFVLDEPSIGLHSRDHRRLIGALERLRDAGNTVIVVEHDRDTIESADHIVDLGPGPGQHGGEVVVEGDFRQTAACARSLTGAYLRGDRAITVPRRRRQPSPEVLELAGVRHNNLKNADVRVPLGLLVAVTGVSGSGKSSLVNQVLYPALLRRLRRLGPEPGRYERLRGGEHVDKLIAIDQSPIGRTSRSNPATYTKVFDRIRSVFAALPLSRARGYKAGRFSFNVEGGRCLECRGTGTNVVDLQFLAPIEVTCEACGGRRFNRETLEICYQRKSIHDVLAMTVEEALEHFRNHPRIRRPLEVLASVGLSYLRLGQAATTLSGGEAQRLKLSSELQKTATGKTLYVLDEPTTGLHFEDIRVLLRALQDLVDLGNTVIVIEHNLDVIKCADHVIDLGPEGGDRGGEVIATGTPEEIARTPGSHTGAALRGVLDPHPETTATRRSPKPLRPVGRAGRLEQAEPREILVEEAHEHNLKGVTVRIPHEKITVITGLSGSGKSSLAFDTVFAEGQRRYVDSLSTYARQFLGKLDRPSVKRIDGLAPAIAVSQGALGSGYRSTVATITEIQDYLRLLYARVGHPHCPRCGQRLVSTTPSRLATRLVENRSGARAYVLAPVAMPVPRGHELESLLDVLVKEGYTRAFAAGREIRLDEAAPTPARRILDAVTRVPPEAAQLHVVVDRIVVDASRQSRLASSLEEAFQRGDGAAAVRIDDDEPTWHSTVPSCPDRHVTFPGMLSPQMFSFNSAEGACPRCRGVGVEPRIDPDRLFPDPTRPVMEAFAPAVRSAFSGPRRSTLELVRALLRQRCIDPRTPVQALRSDDRQAILRGEGAERVRVRLGSSEFEARWKGIANLLERWIHDGDAVGSRNEIQQLCKLEPCASCGGARLRAESLHVRVGERNIHSFASQTVSEAARFLDTLTLSSGEALIAREILRELRNRLRFLEEVGLGYMGLDRTASTLSGGEAQRIRLASQLGNRLVGVIYVLDEPTVGLHPRDTGRLLASLRELRDQGNTIIVVEHDLETIEAADHVIDMGPGAGEHGGEVVACGTPAAVAGSPTSLTGRYLRSEGGFEPRGPRPPGDRWLELEGVSCHNISGLDVRFPLERFTVVTGVSGSGKSSLVLDVLGEVLTCHQKGLGLPSGTVKRVRGLEGVSRAILVDQRPLGRTPRSTPATYSGAWDPIRALYSSLPLARVRGWGPGRFSFNSPEGRCPACEGQGARLIDMHFLSDVWVTCDLCRGRRFDDATLEVKFRGATISDVLDLTADDASELFANQPRILRRIEALRTVGAGYLRLGQSAGTLSGGEAQRVRLASELVERREGGAVYILDEPTTGLHLEDVRQLLEALHRLVERSNTLVVIEHHLDVIAAADWVLDLGPEGGSEGGRLVASGPPDKVAHAEISHTGRSLKAHLGRRRRGALTR